MEWSWKIVQILIVITIYGLYYIIGEFVTCTESECSCKNNNELCELDCNIQDSCTVANCNDDNVCNVFCAVAVGYGLDGIIGGIFNIFGVGILW